MEIINVIKDNWLLLVFALLVVVGIVGGPKSVMASVKRFVPSMSISDGAPDGQDAFDAATVLCEFLPNDKAEELCKLVSPYLLMDHHKDES